MQDNFIQTPSRDNYMITGQDPYRNINANQNQWMPTDHRWQVQQKMIQPPEYDNAMSMPIRDNQDLSIPQQMQKQVQRLQQRPDWAVKPLLPVIPDTPQNIIQTDKLINSQIPLKVVSSSVSEDSSASVDETDYDDDDDIKTTEPPKKKFKKHKSKSKELVSSSNPTKPEKKIVDQPMHEQLKMINNDLEIEFVDHDGPADRPGGAVLSLTLGIIVTVALAILVGCRMRAARRRVRRNGKSPYAHDADFLVNGMYL